MGVPESALIMTVFRLSFVRAFARIHEKTDLPLPELPQMAIIFPTKSLSF
jgi:hypothetical protein